MALVQNKLVDIIKAGLNLNKWQVLLYNEIFGNGGVSTEAGNNILYQYDYTIIIRPQENRQSMLHGNIATTKPSVASPATPFNVRFIATYIQKIDFIVMTKNPDTAIEGSGLTPENSAETGVFILQSFLASPFAQKRAEEQGIIIPLRPALNRDVSYNEEGSKVSRFDLTYNIQYSFTNDRLQEDYITSATVEATFIN